MLVDQSAEQAVESTEVVVDYFTLDGTDHTAQEAAIARYIRWRNKHAQPKRHFAIGPRIRQPDYLPLSA